MQVSFDKLFEDWNAGVSSSDIFHSLFAWIYNHKSKIIDKKVLEEIGKFEDLMNSQASINDIVETFFYGNACQVWRNYMGH